MTEPRPGLVETPEITPEELRLATRNHGMPLEALQWPVTPLGLHYLLIHFDIPALDPSSWSLELGGAFERPVVLSLEELRARPAHSVTVTMECAGNGRAQLEPRPLSQPWGLEAVGTATWTGVPLRSLLDEAGLGPDVVDVVFTGADHGVEGGVEQDYERSLPVEEVQREDVLLAYAINGEPLPPQHGAPLRLVVPGWYGMTNVKWLTRITAVTEPYAGYQNAQGYRFKQDADDPGEPVTRMRPRALMVPPGVPEFMTRHRFAERGPIPIAGRAWSGLGPIVAVEVSTDRGATWHEATLETPGDEFAWCGWSWTWMPAAPGEYEVWCRARDATGAEQPDDPAWNLKGYANTAVQRVPVTVR